MNLRNEFPIGKIINNRYCILRTLGKGGFGDIYQVEDRNTHKKYALKTEYLNAEKQALKNEIEMLNNLKNPFIPKIYFSDENSECRFCVMNVFGPSLADCKKLSRHCYLPSHYVLLIASETLYILESLHKQGIVHRDIKPSNFLLRPHNKIPLCLIDFGLSGYYLTNSKKIIENANGKFIGTKKYASIFTHQKNQQTPRDDLHSWLYMIADLSLKKLPWSREKDSDEVLSIKKQTTASELCKNLPSRCIDLFRVVNDLEYGEIPDYKRLYSIIEEAKQQNSSEYCGDEWKCLWELDMEKSELVNREPGDEKYDKFDPLNPHKNYPTVSFERKNKCNIM
ncbi:putative casein kinase [Tritrichomonas foetus]|uniref:non-specific serine/threonine protein kinase n=1 Tax=Tritrichomonas foetus TaxID=1144522 RepID=A0A1J4K3B7_9EUKA|nr:putative casein kinase [Tritrichomonas foetus]|eukprot:OHT03989.1 putative casein kinase [Tritrichomonas foetus]